MEKTNLLKNFKIYLNERFPIEKNAFIVLIFTLSMFVYTKSLYFNETTTLPKMIFIPKVLMLFVIVSLFFFQLRVLDEIKDYEIDLKYRAYRPVQRGIISLKTLKNIGIVTVFIQIIFAVLIEKELLIYIVLTWIYMILMRYEFFVKKYLEKHFVIYALSHIVVMIFITLVLYKGNFFIFDNIAARNCQLSNQFCNTKGNINWGLICYFAHSYVIGIILEIGRKTRKFEEEETGVETYSKLWGRKNASFTLCVLYFIDFLLILGALQEISSKYAEFSFFALGAFLIISYYFTLKKFLMDNLSGKIVENVSGIWILFSYLNLGVMQAMIGVMMK